MTARRYWSVVGLSLGAVAGVAAVVSLFFGLPVAIAVLTFVGLHMAGLLIGVIPPGRPPRAGIDASTATHDTEPIWPYIAPRAQPGYAEEGWHRMLDEQGEDTSWAAWTLVTLLLAGAVGGTVAFVIALGDDDIPIASDLAGNLDPGAASSPEIATVEPTETAVPEPTETPTPEPTETPSPTPIPPTATPAQQPPAPSATPSPTQGPRSDRSPSNLSLSGAWVAVDVVTSGSERGQTYSFPVTLRHDGERVTGSGGGFTFDGRLDDDVLTVRYSRPNASTGGGVFVWRVVNEDLLVGEFRENVGGIAGASTLTRVP